MNALLPDEHVAVIVLTNSDAFHGPATSPDQTAARILDIVAPDGVHLGTGDGTFGTPSPADALVDPTLGTYPSAIAVGDFNDDNNLDAAVALTATETATLTALSIGGAVSIGVGSGAGVAGAGAGGSSTNKVANTVEAFLADGASVTTTTGGDVTLTALDTPRMTSGKSPTNSRAYWR